MLFCWSALELNVSEAELGAFLLHITLVQEQVITVVCVTDKRQNPQRSSLREKKNLDIQSETMQESSFSLFFSCYCKMPCLFLCHPFYLIPKSNCTTPDNVFKTVLCLPQITEKLHFSHQLFNYKKSDEIRIIPRSTVKWDRKSSLLDMPQTLLSRVW